MWVWLKLKLAPKGDFCEVCVTASFLFLFTNFFIHSSKRCLNESIFSYFTSQTTEARPKSANDEHPRHFCMGKQITICST